MWWEISSLHGTTRLTMRNVNRTSGPSIVNVLVHPGIDTIEILSLTTYVTFSR